MRRIVVLGVLLAMMLAITALQTSQSAAHDPMTLAAIGFVILAAYTVSEVGSLLQLPQVTGYIVAGLALGPAAANILSSEVVVEMKMFNTLALGLIATGAGLELDVSRLRRVWKTLIATVGVKVILSGSFVIATLLAVQTALGSLELGSKAELISLSLVLGVLSLTTSPAIVMAVLNETKSKGRMTDLALGAAVLKDLVVVTLLALVVAVSRTLLAPDAEVDARVIINVGKEIASSIAAGGVLGVLLILYIRYVRAEMLLFVAAMILVVSELGRALHLEILLVFITAGFVVRNFSHHEEELASPLSLVSLPVFVLFFTNAGASVDLRTTLTILPLALAICAARAIAFYLSARAGGAVGQEDFQVRRFAWLGYLPQAGVTLGLVGLAAQQLPDLAGPISTTGMAMVAINLLIGPISLRHALRATGDIEGVPASRRSSAPSSKHPSVIPEEPLEKAEADAAASIERATAAIDEEKNEKLRSMAQQTHTHLRQSVDGFYRDLLEPWAATFRSELRDSLTMIAKDRGSPQVWLESITLPDVSAQGETCKKLFESLRSPISSLPDHVTADLDASQLAVSSDDSIALFIRKRFRSLWILAFRQPAVRTIPVRLVARSSLEPSLSAISAAVLESWYAMQAGMLHQLSAFASDSESLAHVLQRTDEQMETWLGRVRASLDMAVSTAMTTMTRTLSEVGSPTMPTTTLRYSTVEPQVREAIRKLHEEPSAWLSKMEAARAAPYLTACLARLDRTTRDAVDRHISQRSESAAQTMVPIILAVRERIATIRNNIENPDLVLDVKAIQQACREAYPEREELQIDRVGDLRPTASIHNVSLDLRAVVRELPEELTVLPPSVNLQDVQRARDVVTRTIHFRALAAHHTLWSFLPPLDDCVQRASLSLSRSNGRVREAIDWALDSVDGIGDGPDDEMPHVEEFLSALEEVEQRLRELEADVHGTTEGLQREVMDCVTSVSRAMLADATGQKAEGPELPGASTWSAQLRQRLSILVAPAKMRMLRYRARAMEIAKRFGGSALSKDLRLRLEKPVLDAVSIHKYVSRWRAPL
ncbi:MAG TPA: cation:proton antiporter, partial [Polyangiaceae bacterium]|nr:cation:proton antiporter [Polyangiaceae bacterium]